MTMGQGSRASSSSPLSAECLPLIMCLDCKRRRLTAAPFSGGKKIMPTSCWILGRKVQNQGWMTLVQFLLNDTAEMKKQRSTN
ncbi:hypothetical protein BS78_05G112300 [Paspalum vaginatum]|nr:hypothetical protein BS78_05G112300 [Paspalum vaginatum]